MRALFNNFFIFHQSFLSYPIPDYFREKLQCQIVSLISTIKAFRIGHGIRVNFQSRKILRDNTVIFPRIKPV